jgi:hypothetical protein
MVNWRLKTFLKIILIILLLTLLLIYLIPKSSDSKIINLVANFDLAEKYGFDAKLLADFLPRFQYFNHRLNNSDILQKKIFSDLPRKGSFLLSRGIIKLNCALTAGGKYKPAEIRLKLKNSDSPIIINIKTGLQTEISLKKSDSSAEHDLGTVIAELYVNQPGALFLLFYKDYFIITGLKVLYGVIKSPVSLSSWNGIEMNIPEDSAIEKVQFAELKQSDDIILKSLETFFISDAKSQAAPFNQLYPFDKAVEYSGKSPFIKRFKARKGSTSQPVIFAPAGSRLKYKDIKLSRKYKLCMKLGFAGRCDLNKLERFPTLNVQIRNKKGEMLENKIFIYKFRPDFWIEIMLDLSKYEGKTITLEFSVPYRDKTSGSEPQYVALLGNPRFNPIRSDDKPNVILIVLDALRSDHLGCYGYPLDTSSFIDEFAGKSILFENVVAAAPNTVMSHRSIFTGLYPSESGFNLIGEFKNGRFVAPLMRTITPKIMTMADYLQSNGYYTAAFTGGVWMSAVNGFDKGFSEFSESRKPKLDISKEVKWVVKWLKEHKDLKFFLFFHTYETHSPYNKTFFLNKLDEYPANLARKNVIARYDSGIFYADKYISVLIKELKNLSLFDNTIIIITADHGERFDLTPEELKLHVHSGTHGDTLYNCELKVPLIIGGWSKLQGGVRLHNQIRNIDILPTVLDWLDIPLKDSITGQSLIPLINTNKKLDRLAYSETSKNFPNPEALIYSLQSSDRKIIKYINLPIGNMEKNKSGAITFEFFNLLADKTEKNDLSIRDPLYKKYLSILEMTIAKCAKKYRINMSETNKISVHDKQLENNLRQLGYLN